jgi:hypothetical protein
MAESGVNTLPIKSVYQSFGGMTGGQRGSAATAPPQAPGTSSSKADKNPTEPEVAAIVGATGSPVVWLAVLAIMLFALMFLAQRFGTEGATFARIKPSFYNVLVIALAAIIGINLFKFVFTKIKVPGLSTIVLNA